MKDVILFYDCNFILLTWSRAFVSTDDIVGGNQYDSLIYNDDFEQETIQWKLTDLWKASPCGVTFCFKLVCRATCPIIIAWSSAL